MTLPVFRPSLDPARVWRELEPVIASGWLGMGPKVAELEKRLAAEVRAKHFISTSSCTAALHLAIHCLDLPPGSRVLTSPITFVSTNAALLWNGLKPVFGSVCPRTGILRERHSIGTCAAMAVHLGGARSSLTSVVGQGYPIIEDCAHAFGASWLTEQGPHMRCWSFHAVKNLAMGDGGGISTNDDALAERLRRLRWFGIDKSTFARTNTMTTTIRQEGKIVHSESKVLGYTTDYAIPELGFKAHMNDITAAIGLAALPALAKQNVRRRQIAVMYQDAFPENCPPYDPYESACHFYPLFFDNREQIERRLTEAGIGYSRHYKPNFLYPAFEQFDRPGECSAMEYYRKALVLPIFPAMTDSEVLWVIRTVRG